MDIQKIKDLKVIFIKLKQPVLVLFLMYLVYLLIGSVIFVSTEEYEDIRTRNKSAQEIMLARNIVATLMNAGYSKEEINLAFKQQREIMKGTAKPKIKSWTQLFGEKVFFAFILISTIGYGNVAPSSEVGRLVCIVYTLIGMPIHVIMMRLLSFEYRSLLRRVLVLAQMYGRSSKIALTVAGCLFFIFFLALFIFLPSYVFTVSDHWDYSLGVYYSFVSLTTIGLGDYIAGVSGAHLHYPLYVVAMLIWLILGLGFAYMVFNMLSYLLGFAIMDKLDCKCHKRTSAKKNLSSLLDVIKDLNWNLTKYTPPVFEHADDIERFEELLEDNPQDVTQEKLMDMMRIMSELREQCFDELSREMSDGIPMTPIIQHAKDNLPSIISQDSVTLTFEVPKEVETLRKPEARGVEVSDQTGTAASASKMPAEKDEQVEKARRETRFRFGSAVDLGKIGSHRVFDDKI